MNRSCGAIIGSRSSPWFHVELRDARMNDPHAALLRRPSLNFVKPPSTFRAPAKLARSDARNATPPPRPASERLIRRSWPEVGEVDVLAHRADILRRSHSGVWISAGLTAFTRSRRPGPERLGHRDRRLGRVVVRHAAQPAVTAHRGDVDDRAAALLADQRHRGARRPDRAPEVDVVGPLPYLVGVLDGPADRGITGVVHENVQPSEVRGGVIDEAFDILAPAHVGDARERRAAGRFDGRLRLVERSLAACADRDPGAFLSELHRDCPAALARCRHCGNLSFNPRSIVCSLLVRCP